MDRKTSLAIIIAVAIILVALILIGQAGIIGFFGKDFWIQSPLSMSIISPENKSYDSVIIDLNWTSDEVLKAAWYSLNNAPNMSLIDFTDHTIDSVTMGRGISVTDIDGDGNADILAGYRGAINWYKNDGSGNFASSPIESSCWSRDVYAIDLDKDGNMDALGACQNYASIGSVNEIAWYENNGSETFSKHTITTNVNEPWGVFAIDVDSDGDIDVLSASQADDKIAWYENNGTQSFTEHAITTFFDDPTKVYAADLNNDGDIDVLSASWFGSDKIAWYENNGSESFTAHTISTTGDTWGVFAIDLDKDGDMDVLGASINDDKITWYENNGAGSFTAHVITASADFADGVFAIDVDSDGDIDVLSGSGNDNKVAWYENDGSQSFAAHTISTSNTAARGVSAADIDSDGSIDAVSIGEAVMWHEAFLGNTTITAQIGSNTLTVYGKNLTNYTTGSTVVFEAGSSCKTVNSNLTLKNDVNSSGTCFTINANDVVLDCAGHTINYSQSTEGYAVNNTGFDNVTIKNCVIENGNAGIPLAHAIYYENSESGQIINNSVVLSDTFSEGIRLKSGSNNIIESNTIEIFEASGNFGMRVWSSSNNTISKNNIISESIGIYLFQNSNYNDLRDNDITAVDKGILLYQSSNNTLSGNNITATDSSGYSISLGTSSIDNNISYNNIYSANISLQNNQPENITAENNFWNTTDCSEIDSKIYDYNDDASKGIASYVPFLDAAWPAGEAAYCFTDDDGDGWPLECIGWANYSAGFGTGAYGYGYAKYGYGFGQYHEMQAEETIWDRILDFSMDVYNFVGGLLGFITTGDTTTEGEYSYGWGYEFCKADCNDNNASIYPTAAELCNSIDDDCDGTIDEGACDITPPAITIVSPAQSASLAAGTTSTTVNITTDENATCRYSGTNSTFDFSDGTAFTVTGNLSHTFTQVTSDGQTYTFYYKCNDSVGNINPTATMHTFSVASPSEEGGGNGGGGGGGGGAAPAPTIQPVTPVTEIVTINLETFTQWVEGQGINVAVEEGTKIDFQIATETGAESHSITVLDINEEAGTITLLISSEPMTVTLHVGETREVDVDGDGTSDILIIFNGFVDGKADIVFKNITPAAKPEEISEEKPLPKLGLEEVLRLVIFVAVIIAYIAAVIVIIKAIRIKKAKIKLKKQKKKSRIRKKKK